jgi:hypothetical protein
VRAALVLVLLLACKSDKPAPAPGPASAVAPAVADAAAPAAPDTCKLGAAAIDGATCPTPEVRATLVAMKKSLDGVVQTVGQAAADPQQFSVMCAQLLLAIERDAKKQGCTLAVPDDKRAEMMTVLEAWYARRTPVTPTGDVPADAVITKIAAVRDATCECKTGACLDSLTPKLAAVGEMPASAPQAARDLASALLADAARCATRVRTITDPAP